MNPEDATRIVDQLASKDDRWLFLAMLVIVLAGGLLVIRYLVRRNEQQSESHNALVEKMVIVLHECKDALERGNAVMEKVLAKLNVLVLGALLLSGCAGSGPNGAWTADDWAAVNRGINDAVTTYERIRYLDRQ